MSEEERKAYTQRKALHNRLCRARKGKLCILFIFYLHIIICNLTYKVALVANNTVNKFNN